MGTPRNACARFRLVFFQKEMVASQVTRMEQNEEFSTIALDIITTNYTRTRNFVNDLANRHKGEPIEQPSGLCAFYYETYIPLLHQAQALLAKKAYNNASELVPNVCESGFRDARIPSPVQKSDAYLSIDTYVTEKLIRLNMTLLLLLFFVVQCSSGDINFINETCGELTFRSDVCVRFLKLDQRSYAATTQEELSSIALDIITNNYTKARDFLKDFPSKHPGEPIREPCNVCANFYDDSTEGLHHAQELMAKKAYKDAWPLVDDAVSTPNLCESAFSDAAVPSPVKQTDKYLLDDSQVTRDLILLSVS
ncbi:hypothetical protein QJS10_CPA05g02243 [Acorus calamus]|uniref:Pectinesterase inhibitor domain-containing protein n=1 Tax=Acorus calamus TaxID=4465 RepID=A0AAV9ESZ8_ACOCL|nr:hypothetical protein QJS10_CPA05g02243 [Acorus calamus]